MKIIFDFCSYAACCDFLQSNNLLSIIRAHEAQDAGSVLNIPIVIYTFIFAIFILFLAIECIEKVKRLVFHL